MRPPKALKEERGAVRSPRFPVPARVALTREGETDRAEGRMTDLSCHGALVVVSRPFPVGAAVVVHFEIVVQGERRVFALPGVVARVSHKGTAVDFGAVPEDQAQLLVDYTMQRLFGGR
jgi:hypothetical protein